MSKYIPAFANIQVGLEMTDAQGEPTLKLVPAVRQVTIMDLLRHTSEISYKYIGGKWVLKVYSQAHLFDGKFDTTSLPSASRNCRWQGSLAHTGATAIPPMCSAA